MSDGGILVREWAGVVSSADPRDIPAGAAQSQLNVQQVKHGVLSVRKGIAPNAELTGTTPASVELRGAYYYQHPFGDYLVTHDSSGQVCARRDYQVESIASSFDATFPISMCKMRNGDLIGVNGHRRGFRWDGLTDEAEDLGLDAPASGPTVTADVAGTRTYYFAYRYIDDTQPNPVVSSLSPITTLEAVGPGAAFNWTSLDVPQQARVTHLELYRSLQDESRVLYLVARIAAGTTGYSNDALDDGKITHLEKDAGSDQIIVTSNNHGLLTGDLIDVYDVIGVAAANGRHTISVHDANRFALQGSIFNGTYRSGTGYWAPGSGPALAKNESLSITNPDGSTAAYRYTPPASYMSVVAQFQDRAVYAVPFRYREGTISASSGSSAVTGSGTNFTAAMVGRYLYVKGEPKPHEITAVASATELTLADNFSETFADTSYVIAPTPAANNQLLVSEPDLPEAVPIENEIILQQNVRDEDSIVGLMPFGSYLFVLKERHIYRVTWVRQPQYDAAVHPHAPRGCLNNRCWTEFEGHAFLMDALGCYRMGAGGEVEPISDPIQDLWRDGTLDLARSDWWFAVADPELHCVRWYVSYVGDEGSLPTRWIEFNVRNGGWTFGQSSLGGFGGGAVMPVGGRPAVVLGGTRDRIFTANRGITDGTTGLLSGSVSGATATTLTDAQADFYGLDGVPIAIVAGTGKGQVRNIASVFTPSAHLPSRTVNLDRAWDVVPDTTSRYWIGAIQWSWKSKLFEILSSQSSSARAITIDYRPTAGDNTLDIRRYLDNATAPENNVMRREAGDLITLSAGSPDAVLSLSSRNGVPGRERLTWNAKNAGRVYNNQWVAVELRGFQGDEAIEVYGLAVEGVA